MDHSKDNDDDDGEEGGKDPPFFIEDPDHSESEGELKCSQLQYPSSCKLAAKLSGGGSPPLLLAFSIPCRRPPQDSSPSPASSLDLQEEEEEEEEEEGSDQPIEEWMILGKEEQVGDSSIQLNLSYWNSSDEDEDQNVKSIKDIWAVSEKDKWGADPSLVGRYFLPGRSQMCNICNRTGHLAKSCYYHRKCPICVLCGTRGHIQRDCPGRPCPSCGLPSHGLGPCGRPPLWGQHCQRCGLTGHLSDVCPDTWRQYHLTIQLGVPHRPWTIHTLKHKKVHCYNCAERGHYGYECSKRRMISGGTLPSLPYVCHYDTTEDIVQLSTRVQKRPKEPVSAGSLPLSDQQVSEPTGESGEESQPVQGRSRSKEVSCRPGRRKTWPERRRERREVKKLRREAQARREGGLLMRSLGNFDDEVCPADPSRSPLHGHKKSTPPPQKKRDEAGGRRNRKGREAERWKRRGGIKRRDLYPRGDVDICSENLLSPKQRVRHRRR